MRVSSMNNRFKFINSLILLQFIWSLFASASAQDSISSAADDERIDKVEVHAIKVPYQVPYDNILQGLRAIDAHPELAPGANLRWAIIAKIDGKFLSAPIKILGTQNTVIIYADEDGMYDLPRTIGGLGEPVKLLIEAKSSDVSLIPYVETHTVKSPNRRIGDLRLECEILWRTEYQSASLILKAALKIAGSPCESKKFASFVYTRKPVESVFLIIDGEKNELKLNNKRNRFMAPLFDQSLGNDSIINIE